jgi:hypothetical protein
MFDLRRRQFMTLISGDAVAGRAPRARSSRGIHTPIRLSNDPEKRYHSG